MLGIIKELKKSFDLLKPYFENENKNRNRLLFFAYLVANGIQALVVMFLFSYMSVFMGMFTLPVVTYQLFFSTLVEFTGALLVYGAAQAAKYLATQKLKLSLLDNLNQDLRGQWLDASKHAYFGIHLQNFKLYPNKVLRGDSSEIIELTFDLLDKALVTTFGFFIGMYRLFSMSALLTFTLFGAEIAIPGLMALGSLVYAIGYNFISSKLSTPLPSLTQKRKDADGHLENVIGHIDSNREAVALQRTSPSEEKFFQRAVKHVNQNRDTEIKVSTWLKFLKKVHEYLSVAVGLIMAAPSIIAQKVQATEVLEINHYFTDIIGFFTATQENVKDITDLDISINRVNDFKQALKKWDEVRKDTKCTQYDKSSFSVKALTVKTPNGRVLVEDSSYTFQTNKITLLEGKTGVGKSTIIKVMAGIWPYSKGECHFPAKASEIHIIPQKPCLPYESTLFEAITHVLGEQMKPSTLDQKRALLARIKLYMKCLDLEKHIPHLGSKRNWSQELSGGELQRIALISAALKQPVVLVLDESMSALDNTTKLKAQAFVKKHIPATILMIDHQPDSTETHTPFYDAKVRLKNKKLISEPIEAPLRKPSLAIV